MNSLAVALIVSMAPTLAVAANYYFSRRANAKVVGNVASAISDNSEAISKNADAIAETSSSAEAKLDVIHVLVNSRLSEALARIALLEQALGIQPDAAPPQ